MSVRASSGWFNRSLTSAANVRSATPARTKPTSLSPISLRTSITFAISRSAEGKSPSSYAEMRHRRVQGDAAKGISLLFGPLRRPQLVELRRHCLALLERCAIVAQALRDHHRPDPAVDRPGQRVPRTWSRVLRNPFVVRRAQRQRRDGFPPVSALGFQCGQPEGMKSLVVLRDRAKLAPGWRMPGWSARWPQRRPGAPWLPECSP